MIFGKGMLLSRSCQASSESNGQKHTTFSHNLYYVKSEAGSCPPPYEAFARPAKLKHPISVRKTANARRAGSKSANAPTDFAALC